MDNAVENYEKDQLDYKVNVQMVTFVIIIMVVILTLVYFIRIYATKREKVLKNMQTEAVLLESVISDHLNYSKYFINIIGRNIQANANNLPYIKRTLQDHFKSQDFNMLFGWRKYSWVNKDYLELVTSTSGIISNPSYVPFLKELVDNSKLDDFNWKDKIVFYISKKGSKNDSLKLIDNLSDPVNGEYMGSVILSYDLDTMIRSLNKRKKNASTNFIIIDQELNIIAQSKHIINNVVNDEELFAKYLHNTLKHLDLSQKEFKNPSYLDMINGVNYYMKPLKTLPFILIVNIDNSVIKHNILDNITKKFIEVCILAVVCLLMIISIYKRETMLRAKAEKATDVANRATKAKTNFLAFTAHEIRSPLGFILTGSEIMTKQLIGELPDAYLKYAEGIHQNSKTILDFITDILDENQIIEGKFKIINSLANIEDIINEAFKISYARYNTSKVKLEYKLEDNLPLVICDKRRILQVLSNLISNGIKYSKDNTTILVTAKIISYGLEIQVIDQGIGMRPDEVPLALSTYGTLQKSNYNSIGSYGLGLPIVKMLLEAHDADLIIKSKEGKGTTVKIIFPKYKLVHNSPKMKNDGTSQK